MDDAARAEPAREAPVPEHRAAVDSEQSDEGEDLMKESGNVVGLDSSDEEEEEDDEEEQRRIAEGFIVDEDDEDGGDDERSHKRKRRHHRRHEVLEEELDEDDLALLDENTRPAGATHKRARPSGEGELEHIFDDEEEGAGGGDVYDDELDDFIEDDEEDAELTGLDEEQREERRRERREARQRERMSGARVDPLRAGLDLEAWDEVHDIFGNGEDYAWALGDEDEEATEEAKRVEYKDIFEPAQIRERMLTEEYDRIKQVDMPERLQLAIPGDEGLALLERKLSDAELDDAAHWTAPRVSPRCNAEFLDEGAPHAHLRREWLACVRQMLAYLINDLLEVPFLTQHRLDELEHAQYDETGRSRETTTLLVRQELLTLSTLGVKYKLLLARKDALRAVFAQLEALDLSLIHI